MAKQTIEQFDLTANHYKKIWGSDMKIYLFDKGPIEKLPFEYRVLEFAPNEHRNTWAYATCCMSSPNINAPIELHVFSSVRDETLIELLTAVVYYHHNTKQLNLNHSVNFGRPWQLSSECDHGLISLPYIDGPELENLFLPGTDKLIKVYWLIPITEAEVNYKIKFGIEALEHKFDEIGLDYINPSRKSMI